MKRSLIGFVAILLSFQLYSQSVPFPPNPGITNQLENWGYTQIGTNWDTSPFLPFYYNGFKFRLMPPNGVTYNSSTKTWTFSDPNKKYPLILFFHGLGEVGTDNNNQLRHGGKRHRDAVLSGEFPGFLLYPQSVTEDNAKYILDKLISVLPIDINRIYVHGLSGGGGYTWKFLTDYPTLVAAAFPMSAADENARVQSLLYTPIRQVQGTEDKNPAPGYSQMIVDWFNNNGGHLQYFLLPNTGHGTWDQMYGRSDFFSWFLSQKKNKIFVRYNKNELCPEATISVDMGFTPGFEAYEWRKDGVLIPNATSHKLIATAYGTYTGRIKNRGVWSEWSDPVEVKTKLPTNTPPIQVNGTRSIVLPAPDGSTVTELALPEGYQSYTWRNASNQVVSTSRVFTNAPVGTYTATATEVNGCATVPSPAFKVISANGINKPDAIAGFLGYATSESQIVLSWTDKPSPNFNETGFEIYRATNASGPFTLIKITAADAITYTDTGLKPNINYFYKIRPVNQYSAGPESEVISVVTQVDNIPPSAPSNLVKTTSSISSISLAWTASTDNIGVYRYDIYKDGAKVLSTENTSATIYNLAEGQTYRFTVRARDMIGNLSVESNHLMAAAEKPAFEYKYYEATSFGPNLPNFNNLTPVSTGYSEFLDLSVRRRDTHFAIMWQGNITIPVAGSYTFITNSDDGSKLYIGSYSEPNLVVNNDGGHGQQDREGTKYFSQPGTYPIVITYYQGTGGFAIENLYWKNTAHGTVTKTAIPLSHFKQSSSTPGTLPPSPTNLVATAVSFDKINLTWTDVSSNELGFRIYRATNNNGPFVAVATVPANTTSFQDSGLKPSTRYYYRITAFGNNGESNPSNQIPRGFVYSYYEAPSMTSLTQINNMTPKKTGNSSFFDVNLRERNQNFALKWVGKIYISTAATYTFYTSSDDGSTLHIDNAQVVSNDNNQNQTERSGSKSLTVGWHDIEVRWRKRTSSNSRLTVSYSRSGMSKTQLNANNASTLFFGTEINAITSALPPAPATPTNVTVTNLSPTSLEVKWKDNSTNETNFVIQRSYLQNNNFVVYKTLPAGTTSFVDHDLFANARYYYRVQAVGEGGTTTSAAASGLTSNNVPELTSINDVVLKFGKTLNVGVLATDEDNDPITLSVQGLPSFATFNDYGDGTGNIQLLPLIGHLGNYSITLIAADNHSGVSSKSFNLTITDKDVPEILPIPNVTVSEGQSTNFIITASSDLGADNLTWSFSGLPSFASYNIVNGDCQITLAPQYIHSGPYTVTVSVTDPLQASTNKTFTINVTDVDPNQKFNVNIVNSVNAGTPWNNVTGRITSSLRDNTGAITPVGVEFLTTAWNTFNDGTLTGNNSGVFPDNVLRDYYYFGIFGAPNTVDVKVSGLDPQKKYNFSFLGSSKWTQVPDNGSTVYTINNVSVSLRVQNNTQNLAKIKSVSPAPDGTVTFTMSKANGTQVGYLNAFTIESVYQDGTVPAAPRMVQAVQNGNEISITWVDAPFNEEGFDIYKSTSAEGPFTKINEEPIAKNTTSFTDGDLQDGTTYYYKLKAFNAYGESDFSDVGSVTIPNLAPQITVYGDLEISPNGFSMLSIIASSDATLTLSGLPDFAYQSPVSASAIDVILLPGSISSGNYTFTATAVDGTGLVTTENIQLVVGETILYRVMVNFSQNSNAPAPWNNTSKAPVINDTFSNLRKENNEISGISLTLLTGFGGVHNEGAITGNNSGAVPDNVLREYYWFGFNGAPAEVNMRVSGLSPVNKYRFKFLASSTFTNNGTITNNGSTVFRIGTKSASVNVQNNTSNFAVIEDVVTDAQGRVTIRASKGPNTTAGYINALIIEALPVDPSEFVPTNLTASGYSKTQVSLTWSDNSPIETGYEIHRSATGAEGSYSVIATVGADVNTYLDNVPQQNTIYYYKVRATTQEGPSEFTNVAKSSAIAFKVLVNVKGDATYDAPIPWNNLSRFGFEGDIFVGFKDDAGLPTGLRMRVKTPLEGSNSWGMNTGNNSGVFPDKVLQAFWFNDAYFPAGEFIIDNLDQTFSYNFGFLGSIINTGAVVNTDFTINGVTVTNRNDQNTSNVSYIRNVRPDANSEVMFTVKESAGSPWSIWNALVIEGFATGGEENANGRKATNNARVLAGGNLREVRYGEASNRLNVYPNPVRTSLHLDIDDGSIGKVRYQFFDLMGKEVKKGEASAENINTQFEIDVDLSSAIYLLKVTYPDGRFDVRKVIKE